MTSHITLWGRRGHAASAEAQRFLKQHGFRADRVLDFETTPPSPEETERIKSFTAADGPLEPPILLTPKGALVGFRERRWARFLEIDKRHDA